MNLQMVQLGFQKIFSIPLHGKGCPKQKEQLGQWFGDTLR
jgi:hypothetical protein